MLAVLLIAGVVVLGLAGLGVRFDHGACFGLPRHSPCATFVVAAVLSAGVGVAIAQRRDRAMVLGLVIGGALLWLFLVVTLVLLCAGA